MTDKKNPKKKIMDWANAKYQSSKQNMLIELSNI